MFFLLMFCLPLSALYMGSPVEPQIMERGFWISEEASFGLKVGYQGDRVITRKMRPSGNAHGKIDTMALSFDQGVMTLNYLDRVEMYGSAGAMHAKLSQRPSFDQNRRHYQTQEGWTAGVGGRFLLAQWGKTVIGIDGKAQWGRPRIKKVSGRGVSNNRESRLKYCEWQASFAVSYTAGWLTPYLGVKYSNVHAKVNRLSSSIYPHGQFKLINQDRFGCAVGCTLSPGKLFDVFAEVQLFDEQAVSFGGNVRF